MSEKRWRLVLHDWIGAAGDSVYDDEPAVLNQHHHGTIYTADDLSDPELLEAIEKRGHFPVFYMCLVREEEVGRE